MAWNVLKPAPIGSAAKNLVTVSYRKNGPKNFCVFIGIPATLAKELGWVDGEKLLFVYGTNSDSGLARLTRTNKKGFTLRLPHKGTEKMHVRLPAWFPMTKVSVKATGVEYRILTSPQPALEIDLPNWLITETGDLGPRRKLF